MKSLIKIQFVRALLDPSLQGHCRRCPLEAAFERRQIEFADKEGTLELVNVKSWLSQFPSHWTEASIVNRNR